MIKKVHNIKQLILSDGHLILGCARPNCFGWNSFGKPQKLNDSNFYRVNKQQPDGFFRKSFTSTIPKPLNDFEASWYKPQIANCQTGFGSSPCNKINNWVGGIGPYSGLKNGNNQRPLLLRCCHWEGLVNSEDRGIANINRGNIIYGGEVFFEDSSNKRQYAFDYEIELSEDTPVQIIEDEEQNYGGGPNQEYYDSGGGGYNNYYYYTKPASSYFQCFSGDTKIRLDNGKLKRMDELSVGDWVPEQLTNFIKIKLLDGRILKITEKHFIYVYKGGNFFDISSLLFAKDVKIGDCLFTEIEGGNEQSLFIQPIISIKLIKEKGIFAPLTTSGDIFVEGILASCFAVEQNSVLQKSIFSNWPLFTKFSHNLNLLFNLFNNYNNNLEMIEELPKWVDFIVIYLLPIVIPFK
uniref:Hint domain-containing protein n=1 Tax=Meloidogyne javanica TaxID=6303 RepID=A0A915MEJ9_MELJA